eukprot:superscaffoldBa00003281_g16547
METVEKECGALGGLFQAIVNDMKCSYPVWEDFSAKATKLHSQLRTTVLAAVAFLDAFQKVADMATNTRVQLGTFSVSLAQQAACWAAKPAFIHNEQQTITVPNFESGSDEDMERKNERTS